MDYYGGVPATENKKQVKKKIFNLAHKSLVNLYAQGHHEVSNWKNLETGSAGTWMDMEAMIIKPTVTL